MLEIICILGATCTGKSEVAIAAASHFGGEIISADSMQVYRGFDIGTAKLRTDQRRGIPHHLIDCCDPTRIFSAGEFQAAADTLILDISRRNRLPIVAGGTGLYIRALLLGLAPLGSADSTVRRQLRQRAAQRGLESMYRLLRRLDPPAAASISPNDRQRILRMLEYRVLTGRRISEAISRKPFAAERYRALKIGLTLPREILRERIHRRVDTMIRMGLVEEVRLLLESGVDPDARPFAAIGYRQIVQYLNKEVPLEGTVEEIKKATCQYAKRQETWFRRERGVTWVQAESLDEVITKVINYIKGKTNERRNEQSQF